jgi:hypothetical protein
MSEHPAHSDPKKKKFSSARVITPHLVQGHRDAHSATLAPRSRAWGTRLIGRLGVEPRIAWFINESLAGR